MGLSALELDVPLATNAAFRSLSPQRSPCGHLSECHLKTPSLSLLPCSLTATWSGNWLFEYLIIHPALSPAVKVSSIRETALISRFKVQHCVLEPGRGRGTKDTWLRGRDCTNRCGTMLHNRSQSKTWNAEPGPETQIRKWGAEPGTWINKNGSVKCSPTWAPFTTLQEAGVVAA